jgi:hypothetical protein
MIGLALWRWSEQVALLKYNTKLGRQILNQKKPSFGMHPKNGKKPLPLTHGKLKLTIIFKLSVFPKENMQKKKKAKKVSFNTTIFYF